MQYDIVFTFCEQYGLFFAFLGSIIGLIRLLSCNRSSCDGMVYFSHFGCKMVSS